MIIRPATVDDMRAVQAIYAHHVLNGLGTFEEVPPTVEEMTARYEAVLEHGLPYLVAEVDSSLDGALNGALAGYCYATPFRPRAAYRHTVENSVYVAPHSTGRGFGSALLAELVAILQSGPWRQVVAVIGDSGNEASIKLHASQGFKPVGTLTSVGFKFGRWVDVVMMQKQLESAVQGVESEADNGAPTPDAH